MFKARVYIIPCFFLIVFGFVTSTAKATTWEKAGSFPYQVSSMYFFDAEHGVVGTGNAPGGMVGLGLIFRTSDGGQTWSQSRVPESYSSVMDIFFRDQQHGYAAVGGGVYTLWRTDDGGENWTEVTEAKGSYGIGVYETSTTLIVTDIYTYSRLSFDKCKSFNRVSLNKAADAMLGVDFTDDLHGVITSYRNGGKWARTSDGGSTWIECNISQECWSIYGEKGTSNFYAAAEGDITESNLTTDIVTSNDNGVSWHTVAKLPFRTTGHITGVGGVLYIQTSSINCLACKGYTQGIYRSTDGGKTWAPLGGPDNVEDRRFKSVQNDCYSNTVFSADNYGNLYRTRDNALPSNSQNATMFTSAITSPKLGVKPGVMMNVPITVGLNPTDVRWLEAKQMAFTLRFPIERLAPSSGGVINLTPPLGWNVASIQPDSLGVRVMLDHATTEKLLTTQPLGTMQCSFTGSENTPISVRLTNLEISTKCETYNLRISPEADIVQAVNFYTNGVMAPVFSTNRLVMMPNPARNSVQLTFEDADEKQTEFRIIDMLGRIVFEDKINQNDAHSRLVNTSSLTSGSYYVQAKIGDELIMKVLEIVK